MKTVKTILIYGETVDAMRTAAEPIRAQKDRAHYRAASLWDGAVERCDGVIIADASAEDAKRVSEAYGDLVMRPEDDTEAKAKAAAEKAAADKAATEKAKADAEVQKAAKK